MYHRLRPKHACVSTHLLKVLVTVDVLLIMGVLQLVGLHILPEGLDDAGARLRVDAQQAGQPRVQLELGGLGTHGTQIQSAAPPERSKRSLQDLCGNERLNQMTLQHCRLD